jgi:protein involved in polysaccharide export with SLBB domain
MDRQQQSHFANGLGARPFALLAVLVALLSACAYRPVHETPINELVDRSAHIDADGYTVQVGDVLTIRFYFNPELDYDVPVRADGAISMSLIGDVAAAGYTTPALSATITKSYRAYLNQPNATVIVKTPAGHRVFVTGEVLTPGVFTLQGNETALSAVSLAGGLTDRATFKQVVLVRRLPGSSEPMVTVLNLQKALNGSDLRQDVKLYMNDVLWVPRTGAAQSNVELRNLIWGKAPFSGSATATWNGVIK